MVQVAHKKPLNTLEKMSKRDQFGPISIHSLTINLNT